MAHARVLQVRRRASPVSRHRLGDRGPRRSHLSGSRRGAVERSQAVLVRVRELGDQRSPGFQLADSARSPSTNGRSSLATAHPRASVADLLALEGDIVGSDAVADPASGRLPDVRAFHRVGISAMRIENGTLSVEFLAGATRGQRSSVRTTLSRSPSITSVTEVRRKP